MRIVSKFDIKNNTSKMLNFTKVFVLLLVHCVAAFALPYQELPPKPGYVPVYIREGNTPLSQINPKLVEAFREDENFSIISIEPAPTKIQIAKNYSTSQVTENIKDDEDTEEKVKQVNGNKLNAEEQRKSHEEAENHEQEVAASDIAKFTSDDIKTLSRDLSDY